MEHFTGPVVHVGVVAWIFLFYLFWIGMLVDCAVRESPTSGTKLAWVLIIIFLQWPGALLYLWFGRSPGSLRSPASRA